MECEPQTAQALTRCYKTHLDEQGIPVERQEDALDWFENNLPTMPKEQVRDLLGAVRAKEFEILDADPS